MHRRTTIALLLCVAAVVLVPGLAQVCWHLFYTAVTWLMANVHIEVGTGA